MTETLLDTVRSPEAKPWPYQCLAEVEDQKMTRANAVAQLVMNLYTGKDLSVSKWKKHRPVIVPWIDREEKPPKEKNSVPLTFNRVAKNLHQKRRFDAVDFHLPKPEIFRNNWMDRGLTIYADYWPVVNETRSQVRCLQLPFGPEFPIKPGNDREGFACASPQFHLQRSILRARHHMILNSFQIASPMTEGPAEGKQTLLVVQDEPPLVPLMDFFNLVVSAVDITLIQLYYAAKYRGGELGLRFDQDKLGHTVARTINDKLKWVQFISGKELDAKGEIENFTRLKNVRNHLAHFDPPCVAVSIDDVSEWLSLLPSVAWLLIKIRSCIGIPVSSDIIRIALAKKVVAVPRDPSKPRHPQSQYAGYQSCIWPKSDDNTQRQEDSFRIPENSLSALQRLRQRVKSITGRELSKADIVSLALKHSLEGILSMDDSSMKSAVENFSQHKNATSDVAF